MRLRSDNESWSIPSPEMKASELTAEGMFSLEADFSEGKIVKYIRDVEYAVIDGRSMKLQLLLPSLTGEEKRPLVMFIRGSAWQKQSVVSGIPQLVALAKRGFIVASVEYREAPANHYPDQSDDGWTALRFLLEHAEEMNLDPTRIATWGSSSGAHTALLMAMHPRYREEAAKISAVIDFYGPTYLPKMIDYHSTSTEHLDELMGFSVKENTERLLEACPAVYADMENAPSVLIFHGDKDRSCSFEQSVILYEAMRKAGQDVTMYRMHNAAHGGSPFWTSEVMDLIEEFLWSRMA